MPCIEPETPNPDMEITIEDVESLLDNSEEPDLLRKFQAKAVLHLKLSS